MFHPPVPGLATTHFLALTLLLALSLRDSQGVKVLEIKVPPRVRSGDTVDLGCRYDLEGASLYSLNWWRGTHQFYQFSPNSNEKVIVYESPGIMVDLTRSGRDVVVLRNVSQASAGRYKCEVLADFPSFEKDSEITSMEVIDVPTSAPVLHVRRSQWSLDEELEANCTSPAVRPPPQIHWYINGNKIHPRHTHLYTDEPVKNRDTGSYVDGGSSYIDMTHMNVMSNMDVMHQMGDMDIHPMEGGMLEAVPRTLELKIRLKKAHFDNDGQALLTCAVTLPGIYHRSSEAHLSLPGFRAAAPSQKLYGGARSHGGAALVVVLSLGALSLLAL